MNITTIIASFFLTTVTLVDPETINWADTVYPGTKISTIFGKTTENDIYAIRFSFPAGSVVQPHTHSKDEYMTVISGSLNVGIGTEVDIDKTIHLSQGGAIGIPANVPHYAIADEDTVIQVHAVGPRDTTFVHSH